MHSLALLGIDQPFIISDTCFLLFEVFNLVIKGSVPRHVIGRKFDDGTCSASAVPSAV
jgi:hypothetical protein